MEKHYLIEEIKKEFLYQPETGKLYRKNGKLAGYVENNGYLRVGFRYRKLLAHQIIFVLMTGDFPKDRVDHKNRNRQDNSWDNLREVSMKQNAWNRNIKGIYKFPETSGRKKKWLAEIVKDGQRYSNYFLTEQEALTWRRQMSISLYGEFSNQVN